MAFKKRESAPLPVRSACILMALIAIARGSSFLLSKSLLVNIQPLNLLGIRFLLAFIVLFLIFFRKTCCVIRKDPGIIIAALILGGVYFVCMAAELIGLQYTSASRCSFIENSAIVLVPVIQAVLIRRPPGKIIIISAIITLLGIGLIVLPGSQDTGFGPGDTLCIAAALLYAAAIIITDRFSKKHDPMTLGILYVGFMGAMGMISSFAAETPGLPADGFQWMLLLGLVLICTCLGFTMQPVAQKPLSAEKAGLICAINPLTTAVLGWTVLGEYQGFIGVIGAALIIFGIMLPNLFKKRG